MTCTLDLTKCSRHISCARLGYYVQATLTRSTWPSVRGRSPRPQTPRRVCSSSSNPGSPTKTSVWRRGESSTPREYAISAELHGDQFADLLARLAAVKDLATTVGELPYE